MSETPARGRRRSGAVPRGHHARRSHATLATSPETEPLRVESCRSPRRCAVCSHDGASRRRCAGLRSLERGWLRPARLRHVRRDGRKSRARIALNDEVLDPGVVPAEIVRTGTATTIATGGILPRGADAVIMVEHTEIDGRTAAIACRNSVAPGENITFAGTDIGKGETVLRRGKRSPRARSAFSQRSAPRKSTCTAGRASRSFPPATRSSRRASRCARRRLRHQRRILADAVEELGGEP